MCSNIDFKAGHNEGARFFAKPEADHPHEKLVLRQEAGDHQQNQQQRALLIPS